MIVDVCAFLVHVNDLDAMLSVTALYAMKLLAGCEQYSDIYSVSNVS